MLPQEVKPVVYESKNPRERFGILIASRKDVCPTPSSLVSSYWSRSRFQSPSDSLYKTPAGIGSNNRLLPGTELETDNTHVESSVPQTAINTLNQTMTSASHSSPMTASPGFMSGQVTPYASSALSTEPYQTPATGFTSPSVYSSTFSSTASSTRRTQSESPLTQPVIHFQGRKWVLEVGSRQVISTTRVKKETITSGVTKDIVDYEASYSMKKYRA